jgi:hypothetical protein
MVPSKSYIPSWNRQAAEFGDDRDVSSAQGKHMTCMHCNNQRFARMLLTKSATGATASLEMSIRLLSSFPWSQTALGRRTMAHFADDSLPSFRKCETLQQQLHAKRTTGLINS